MTTTTIITITITVTTTMVMATTITRNADEKKPADGGRQHKALNA